MCGICGYIGLKKDIDISPMVSAMKHRGPDDSRIYKEESLALGMARLAIIDITASGHQPMYNDDKTIWIVYNGETYNFREEKEFLIKKGYQFRSTSDTEVVLKMYQQYGRDFLKRMRGIFALAIYDKRGGIEKRQLLLARDHLGIKPLLYSKIDSGVIFASEIKSILSSGIINKSINREALRQLITYGSIAQPNTIIDGVKMLLPGQYAVLQGNDFKINSYWELGTDRIKEVKNLSFSDQVLFLKDKLEECVNLQMISDVPIGAFLSGGIDSSLLVALMARITKNNVKTFSVGFLNEAKDIDESDDAQIIAKHLGTDHSKVVVTGNDVRDSISHIAKALDQPSVDGVNSYFVSKAARKSVTVAISGTGGDELFAGYPWFISMVKYAHRTQGFKFHKLLGNFFSYGYFNHLINSSIGSYIEKYRSISGFVPFYARQNQVFGSLGASTILSEDIKKQCSIGIEPSFDEYFTNEIPDGTPIQQTTALCMRGYTQNQLLRDIDAVSMSHSLEVRVPFLDPVITDLALSLPDSTKLFDYQKIPDKKYPSYLESGAKRILIEISKEFLPHNLDKQEKRGFGLPFNNWLKASLKEIFNDTLSESTIRKRGFFNVSQTEIIKKQFLLNKIHWVYPWLLMITELWCREIIDKEF